MYFSKCCSLFRSSVKKHTVKFLLFCSPTQLPGLGRLAQRVTLLTLTKSDNLSLSSDLKLIFSENLLCEYCPVGKIG